MRDGRGGCDVDISLKRLNLEIDLAVSLQFNVHDCSNMQDVCPMSQTTWP